jgi:serine protease Do
MRAALDRAALASLAILPALAGCEFGGPAHAQTRDSIMTNVSYSLDGVPGTVDTAMAAQLSGAFRGAAGRALPAVVQIRVTARPRPDSRTGRVHPPGTELRSRSTGSGFILDERGHVVTNNHVVQGAELLTVVLTDGRDYDATLVGADPYTDVAVIRLNGTPADGLAAARLGDSDELEVGDWVLALGNPLGLQFTVTAGIVSAKGRAINILESPDNTQLEAFIQTDAAINPGNSGGPLVDLLGRVVGVNSAIESRTGFFSGAGFAIPINLAAKVADDLIRYGVVRRPRLGVIIQDVNAADAEIYGLPAVTGAEIASVTPGSPAEQGGLEMGDVVVAVNSQRIGSVTDLQATVARFQPGDSVGLSVIRYGTRLDRAVRLGEFAPAPEQTLTAREPATGVHLLGFTVGDLPENLGGNIGLRDESRLAITEVTPFGPAEEALIPRGVILLRLNGQPVRTRDDVERIVAGIEVGDIVSVVTLRPRADDAAPTIFNYRVR